MKGSLHELFLGNPCEGRVFRRGEIGAGCGGTLPKSYEISGKQKRSPWVVLIHGERYSLHLLCSGKSSE